MVQAISDALYAAYNSQSLADVRRLYSVDAIHDDVPIGRPKKGRDEIAAGLEQFFRWFPDAQWQAAASAVGQNVIATTYTLSASLQSDFHGVPARGQKIRIRGVHVLYLSRNEIGRSEDYWDAKTFERQLHDYEKELEA